MTLRGGCFCGAVRYETDAATADATLCHCADCRRAAGAPVVAWFTVPRETLRMAGEAPKRFRSSDRAVRAFCGRCGTTLLFEEDGRPAETDVATATLDEPEAVPPIDHTFTSSRLSWMPLADDLPAFPGARPGDG